MSRGDATVCLFVSAVIICLEASNRWLPPSFETIGAMTSSFIQGAANLDGNPEPLSESESFFKPSSASKTNLNSSWLDVVCLV